MVAILSSLGAFKVAFATALGLPLPTIVEVIVGDLVEQVENAPRLLPRYSTGNVFGINTPREFQHYGAPYFGGLGSNIRPPLSPEEFRNMFFFPQEKILEVLAAFQFPRSLGRPADQDFAYMFDADGAPIRWVSQETAFLVFLRRLRTRGSVIIQLQSFFGRSIGWISLVFNAVLNFLNSRWVPTKIQALDRSVFTYFRLKDYEKCLWNAGLYISRCVGFVDGTFHATRRPGRDGHNGQLQRLFYSGAKKNMASSSR